MTTASLRRLSAAALLGALALTTVLCSVPMLPAGAVDAKPAAAQVADRETKAYDLWYNESTPSGRRGWSRRTVEKTPDGNWVTIYRSYSKESHGSSVQIEEGEKRVVESPDRRVLSITTTSTSSAGAFKQEQKQSWVFGKDGIDMTVSSSGREQKRRLPLPEGEWLSPLGVEARKTALMAAGVEKFEIPAYEPGMGSKVYHEQYERVGEEEVQVDGGAKIKAVKYKMLTSNLPGVDSFEWWDAEGRFVHNEFTMSKLKFITNLATEAVAKADFEASDAIGVSVVDCQPAAPKDLPLLSRAVWELDYNKKATVNPVSLGQHKVEVLGPGRARVTIDLGADDTRDQSFKPVDADLGVSTSVDWKDEKIQELAKQVQALVGPNATQDQIGFASRNFVSRYLRPSLDVGSGTASEVARARTGDCSEHAVLLVALLRAQGIPARQVTGMSYAGDEGFVGNSNCFIYHAWTLAWLKNAQGVSRWVNLDAAIGNRQISRIILNTSSMDDVSGADESIGSMSMMQDMKAAFVPPAKPAKPAVPATP